MATALAGDRFDRTPAVGGGATCSEFIEALGPAIFAMVEEAVPIALARIARRLGAVQGQRFARSTMHRFFRQFAFGASLAGAKLAKGEVAPNRDVAGPGNIGGGRGAPVWCGAADE